MKILSLSLLLLLFSLVACNKEPNSTSSQAIESSEVRSEDYSEFKAKDESCDSEEELKKKLEEDLKKNEGKLTLGGATDGGCEVK